MKYLKYAIAILAGAVLPCAFSPVKIWILSFLSPLVLLILWNKSTPGQAFRLGWVYGFACFTVGIGWSKACFISSGYSQLISSLGMFGFISILGFFTGAPGYIIRKFYKNYSSSELWFVFPSSWVILEWVRSWLWTGFPWLLMGYTQIDSPLRNYAPICGVYGLSFLLLSSVGLIYTIIDFNGLQTRVSWNKKKSLAVLLIAGIWFGGYILSAVTWTQVQDTTHTVSIIQPNLTPEVKIKLSLHEHFAIYGPLTRNVLNSSLIVWPEYSVPYSIPYSQPVLDELDRIGKKYNTTIIVGTMDLIPNTNSYYNNLVVLGMGSGKYVKRHLVPLWEYLPYESYLHKILDFLKVVIPQIRSGSPIQEKLHIPGTSLLPFICYEIAFPEAVRRELNVSDAKAIVNISEDGWYVNTWAIGQNLDMVRMRALENGRYIIKSTTSGFSTIVDYKGKVLAKASLYTPQVISGSFVDVVGSTPWTRLGAAKIMMCIYIVWFLASINYTWAFKFRYALNNTISNGRSNV